MSVSCKYCGAHAGYGHELGHRSNCPTLKQNFKENAIFDLNYSPKDVIHACGEAHQGGQDYILCNLICLISDFKAKNMDRETILKKLDEFVERFK